MESFYRNIFKRAWKISWKNKKLWLFGFFATFLGGGTVYEVVVRNFSNVREGHSIFYTLREYGQTGLFSTFSWDKMAQLFSRDPATFTVSLFSLLILLVMALIVIIFAVISQTALIKSAIWLDEKKKITISQAFHLGVRKFWPVFWLNFIMKVVIFGLILFLAFLVSLMPMTGLISSLIYVLAFAVLLILAIVVYFLTIYAIAFIVLRDKDIWHSIFLAWEIFKKNILLNIEFGFILFITSLLVYLLSAIVAFFVLSPFILLYFLCLVLSMNGGVSFFGFILSLLMILIIVLVGSWFTSFQITGWSLLFEEVVLKKPKSKLMRIIHHFKKPGKKKKSRRKKSKK